MVSLKATIILGLLFLSLTTNVYAQQDPYIVRGKVYLNNETIDNITVYVVIDRTQSTIISKSDSAGVFSMLLSNYKEGDTYHIGVNYPGYNATKTAHIVKYEPGGVVREGDYHELYLYEDLGTTKQKEYIPSIFEIIGVFGLIIFATALFHYSVYLESKGGSRSKK